MGSKKEKTMNAEGAQKLLAVIEKYENTKEGDPKRGHFGDIIWWALEVHAVKRDADGSLGTYNIGKNAITNSFKSVGSDVAPDTRRAFIRTLKGKIDAVLNPASGKPAPAAAEASPATM